MRPHAAIPRWNRLVTNPNAIIGQLSMSRYALKATNCPTVMRPSMTCRAPSHSTSTPASPRMNPRLG